MKCPQCGGEIASNSRQCEYCGSQITVDMMREQQELNKDGCPNCGSTNISFTREKQGEVIESDSRRQGSKKVKTTTTAQVLYATIGYCNDCGHTWATTPVEEAPKKRRTWLWVLGWIFCFPIPLTILMLNSERTAHIDKRIRIGIVVAVWALVILVGMSKAANG